MKNKVFFLSGLILCMAFMSIFVSCDSDNDNDNENTDNEITVLQNMLSAKWEISNSNSPYTSIEFNKDGNYIIVGKNARTGLKSDLSANPKNPLLKTNFIKNSLSSTKSDSNLSPIHFGTYKIEGNNIILSGFGLIEVISLTENEFTFSFTLESTGEKNSFVAGRFSEPISSTTRTDMFCRTWTIDKVAVSLDAFSQENLDYYEGIYGANWKSKLEEMLTEEYMGMCALFSRAGTYLVLYDGDEGSAGLSEWRWANMEETEIYYSWDNWTDDWNNNIVTITELEANSLVLQEDEEIWFFKLKK